MTEVMPHASLAAPLFGALVNTDKEDDAEVGEYGGEVIAEVLHPSIFLVCGQVPIVGFTVSSTVIV